MMEDTRCKTCESELVWTGSMTDGHMKCGNPYCLTNKPTINHRTYPTAEELEFDAADD